MIEDFSIRNDVWEAALTVSNYAKQQGWGKNWCIGDVCSRDAITSLEKETKKWKDNHDNQVKLKSILIQRPDLGDRAERIQKLINENSALKAEYEKLKHICVRIYYARIAGCEKTVIEGLKDIDNYFREPNMN